MGGALLFKDNGDNGIVYLQEIVSISALFILTVAAMIGNYHSEGLPTILIFLMSKQKLDTLLGFWELFLVYGVLYSELKAYYTRCFDYSSSEPRKIGPYFSTKYNFLFFYIFVFTCAF